MRWLEASTAVLGILTIAMSEAKAGREEGLAACHAGEWKTAAHELLPEEATTTDAAVVRCLADIYFGGLNVPRDPQRAFGLWKRLADLGNDEAQDMVGYFYLDGVGTDRDPGKAEQLFLRSAEQGNQNAMSELSLYYSLGFIGCCPNQQKAMYWTMRLAALGNLQAEVELVRAYSRGEVVQRDDKQAVHWALLAAEQDSTEAFLFLGYATKQGAGTERNLVEAYKWFSIAAAHTKAAEGAEAVRQRDEIARQLTAAQLRQAQRMALEWWIRPRSP
jgi:TPR repeat protein